MSMCTDMCLSVPRIQCCVCLRKKVVLQQSLWEPESGDECRRCRWEAGGEMFCSV